MVKVVLLTEDDLTCRLMGRLGDVRLKESVRFKQTHKTASELSRTSQTCSDIVGTGIGIIGQFLSHWSTEVFGSLAQGF